MELVFSVIAGFFTLINPCVLPVLPIVLASAVQSSRHGPLALAAGMSVSFVLFGMLVATVGQSIGLTERVLSRTGALLMVGFGLVLLIPVLSGRFTALVAGLGARADSRMACLSSATLRSQFVGGMLLGAVWSPCIGPTLGGAIALASQGESLLWAFAIMCGFALGVSLVILLLGYGTQEMIRRRQQQLRGLAVRAKPLMGVLFVAVGVMILTGFHHLIEGAVLAVMPVWLQDLSVRF